MRRSEAGFSLIEVIVVAAVIGVLAALAIPNFQEFRTRAYNTTALRDYTNIKIAMYAEGADPETTPSFIFFNREVPGPLPNPMSQVSLSADVRLYYAYRLNFFNFFDLTAIQIAHTKGDRGYRYLEINGDRLEQVFTF